MTPRDEVRYARPEDLHERRDNCATTGCVPVVQVPRIEDRLKIRDEKATIEQHYTCGCGCEVWVLERSGDCICANCLRAQARIYIVELGGIPSDPPRRRRR
jgi:hypothetical protein